MSLFEYSAANLSRNAERYFGKYRGVVINNIEGHRYIKARAFIGATGDAVLTW